MFGFWKKEKCACSCDSGCCKSEEVDNKLADSHPTEVKAPEKDTEKDTEEDTKEDVGEEKYSEIRISFKRKSGYYDRTWHCKVTPEQQKEFGWRWRNAPYVAFLQWWYDTDEPYYAFCYNNGEIMIQRNMVATFEIKEYNGEKNEKNT